MWLAHESSGRLDNIAHRVYKLDHAHLTSSSGCTQSGLKPGILDGTVYLGPSRHLEPSKLKDLRTRGLPVEAPDPALKVLRISGL